MPQQPRCKALWVTFDNSSHPHSKTASSYFRTPANCICLSVPLHSYFHWAGSLLFLMLRNMLPYFSVTSSSPCPPKREPECIAFFVLAYSAPFSWPNVSNFLPSRKHWAFSSKSDKDSWLALPNAVWKEVIGVLWVEISAQLTRSPSPSLAIMETWHRGFSQTWSRVRGRFPQLTHMDLCSFEWVIILCGSKPLGPQAQLMWSWLIPSSFALSLSLSYACTHLVLLMDKLDAFICITLQFAFYHWIIHDGQSFQVCRYEYIWFTFLPMTKYSISNGGTGLLSISLLVIVHGKAGAPYPAATIFSQISLSATFPFP